MTVAKLTKRTVDATRIRQSDFVIWDADLAGFGLRVRPSGIKSYIVQYRAGGGRAGVVRKITLGRHGSPWTPEQARAEAKRILGAVANGEDPAKQRAVRRAEITVGQLCDLYISEGCVTKKASTISTDVGRIERHIKPLLGRKRVSEISRADIQRFLSDVAAGKTKADVKTGKRGRAIVEGGRGTATRTVGLLGGIFSFAEGRGLRAKNPVRGVKRFPDQKSERFLSPAELAKLGASLSVAETEGANPSAIAVIRLLAFTGARKSEIASLRWAEVDFGHACLRLGDSKTGQKIIPLGAPALEILSALPRRDSSPYVFPATVGDGRFQGVDKTWRQVRRAAGFPELRLHDLRHSYASMGLAQGDALPVIGVLLGHADVKTTSRYAHLADDPVKAAADRIAGAVASAMRGQDTKKGEVVRLRRH